MTLSGLLKPRREYGDALGYGRCKRNAYIILRGERIFPDPGTAALLFCYWQTRRGAVYSAPRISDLKKLKYGQRMKDRVALAHGSLRWSSGHSKAWSICASPVFVQKKDIYQQIDKSLTLCSIPNPLGLFSQLTFFSLLGPAYRLPFSCHLGASCFTTLL